MQQKIMAQAKRFWNGFLSFTPGQKAVTIAAVLALVIGGFLFSSWAAKPSYAPLFTNLSPTDASGIIDKLNANKTPYQLAANGTEILVPSKDVYSSRLALSAAGLPASNSNSFDLLDKEGITTSEFKQNVDYQRGVQGELGNTIKAIDGVQNATVNLAIPQDTVFSDGTSKATASVLLTLDPGTSLTSDQVKSIVNLVSSSVPGLTADNVSLSDTTGKNYSIAGTGTTGATGSSDQAAATNAYVTSTTNNIQQMLDTLVGPGHSTVKMSANLDFNKTHDVLNKPVYVSGPPVAISQSIESMAPGASGNSNGVLGATSPSPTAAGGTGGTTSGTGGTGGYSNKNTVQNNPYGSDTTTTDKAPGSVNNQTIAVVIDQSYATKLNQAQLKQLVGNAAGFNAKRGDQMTVSFQPFDQTSAQAAAAAAKKAASDAAAAKSKAALMNMIKTGGVVLLVILVVVLSLMFGRKRKEEPGDDLDAFLQTLNDGNLPPAPKDIVPQNREQAIHLARQRDLAEMADSQPQEVARLLRTWMNSKES